jgi:replication initiation and membrane attachment protein DnaB
MPSLEVKIPMPVATIRKTRIESVKLDASGEKVGHQSVRNAHKLPSTQEEREVKSSDRSILTNIFICNMNHEVMNIIVCIMSLGMLPYMFS